MTPHPARVHACVASIASWDLYGYTSYVGSMHLAAPVGPIPADAVGDGVRETPFWELHRIWHEMMARFRPA